MLKCLESVAKVKLVELVPLSRGLPKGHLPNMTQGQEVKFHEIKIQLFQEVDTSIMRSKFLIMIQFPDLGIFHEIEIA